MNKIVVIGSGAGGSSIIDRLVRNGVDPSDIILLEKGRYLDKHQSEAARFIQGYKQAGVYPVLGKPLIPFGIGECLGGGPEVNGALIWKTPKHILDTWFSGRYSLPFSRSLLENEFHHFENILNVSTSYFSKPTKCR